MKEQMYLVSSYWRGALNIGDMRVVNDVSALELELERLRSGSPRSLALDEFIAQGFYRVYKFEFGQPAKLVKQKELKELLGAQ